MRKINEDIFKMDDENEFMRASRLVKEYKESHPEEKVLSLGIGDVSFPIIPPVIEAMHRAVDDLARRETFHGYGDSSGYLFLKEAILKNDYANFSFTEDEIYISNGTKTDATSLLELFDIHSKIAIPNPIYPIYKNGAFCLNRMVSYLTVKEEDNFVPQVPKEKYDIVYLCSPHNPVGNAYTFEQLKKWVEYAQKNNAVILYDNAYYAFIQSKNVPKSIYEIEGAKNIAIEMRSYSKSLSFTGVRCSYYVIPKELAPNINAVWKKRTINRFNGADYIAQRGAEASYCEEAQQEIRKNIQEYHENTMHLKAFFEQLGYVVYGGIDSPFLWVKLKHHLSSWKVFHEYLAKLNIVITPGIIFGKEGDGFIRISGLASKEIIQEAMERIKKYEEME